MIERGFAFDSKIDDSPVASCDRQGWGHVAEGQGALSTTANESIEHHVNLFASNSNDAVIMAVFAWKIQMDRKIHKIFCKAE
jgi:hypothetical protein